MGTVTVYRDQAGEWRWHRVEGGNITAESGEGYVNRDDCTAQATKLANPGDTVRIELKGGGRIEFSAPPTSDARQNGTPPGD